MPDYEQDVLRGRQAQELLEHPLLIEAFEALESEVLSAWKASPARDVEGREKLWLMLSLCEKVKNQITSVVNTGKIAQKELESLTRRSLLQRVGLG